MVEAAESGQGDDLGVTNRPGLPWAARGCGLGEAEVGAVIMVIGDVVSQQAKQVAVVEDVASDLVAEVVQRADQPRVPQLGFSVAILTTERLLPRAN